MGETNNLSLVFAGWNKPICFWVNLRFVPSVGNALRGGWWSFWSCTRVVFSACVFWLSNSRRHQIITSSQLHCKRCGKWPYCKGNDPFSWNYVPLNHDWRKAIVHPGIFWYVPRWCLGALNKQLDPLTCFAGRKKIQQNPLALKIRPFWKLYLPSSKSPGLSFHFFVFVKVHLTENVECFFLLCLLMLRFLVACCMLNKYLGGLWWMHL